MSIRKFTSQTQKFVEIDFKLIVCSIFLSETAPILYGSLTERYGSSGKYTNIESVYQYPPCLPSHLCSPSPTVFKTINNIHLLHALIFFQFSFIYTCKDFYFFLKYRETKIFKLAQKTS